MWKLKWEEVIESYKGTRLIKTRKQIESKLFTSKREAKKYIKKWKLNSVTTYSLTKLKATN
jgi:hypothetical protein